MLYKVKAFGSADKRFVMIETSQGDKWVEIDLTDGTIKREIQPRRFVEYDDTGKIIAVHNIEYSELLETAGVEAFTAGKRMFEVKEKALEGTDGGELLEKYHVKAGKLEKKI